MKTCYCHIPPDLLVKIVREMLKGQPDFLTHFLDCRIHAREVLEGKLPDLKKHLSESL